MARQHRLDIPGIPQHIIQRGNNRLPCFLDDVDRLRYSRLLQESLQTTDCKLHAYVLMDNHVHLLATPPQAGAIARLMQRLGTRYVWWFNVRHGRTGTLWEGRYKSCLVDSDDYLLRCTRYIDLNPVRAGMTSDPSTFQWSSCPALCAVREDPLVSLHPTQLGLGSSARERGDAYRALLDEALSEVDLSSIRNYLQQQRAYGRDDFQAMVEAKTRQFAGLRPAHRPRKESTSGRSTGK